MLYTYEATSWFLGKFCMDNHFVELVYLLYGLRSVNPESIKTAVAGIKSYTAKGVFLFLDSPNRQY